MAENKEKAGFLKTIRKVTTGLLKDTGFGLTVSSVLLFAATNPYGLATMLAGGAVITAIKTAQILDVDFLRKENAVTKFIKDRSTTMTILGVSGLVVAAQCLLLNPYTLPTSGNLLQGAVELGKQAIPFLTATAAAVSNLMIGVQYKREEREQKEAKERAEKDLPAIERKKTSFLKLPEPYTASALMMRGLMAGGGR